MVFMEILQLRIALTSIDPPIWRRIQIPPTSTFWELHVAIQDAMGWSDSHLHVFRVFDLQSDEVAEIGIPIDNFPSRRRTLHDREVPVGAHLTEFSSVLIYGTSVIRVLEAESDEEDQLVVGVVQANVDLHDKWDVAKRDSTFVPYTLGTRSVAADGARLSVWAETARLQPAGSR